MELDTRQLETRLRDEAETWSRRLEKIKADRRRKNGPLDPDFAEQATQRENDETLDALDERGRAQLRAIDAALERIRNGSYGCCARCEETISTARLEAQPTAALCAPCAQRGEQSG